MKNIVALCIGGILYYITAIYGMSIFSFEPSNITILWLPFAIGVIFTHRYGNKFLPLIFLGSFFSNFSGMNNGDLFSTIVYTLVSSGADTIAPYFSVILLKQYVDDKFDSINGFLPFTLYGVLIPTFISSLIISFNLYFGSYIKINEIWSYIILLIFADGLGLFLLYPIYKNFSKVIPEYKELKEIIIYSILIFSLVYFSFSFTFLIFIFSTLIVVLAFKIREDIVSIIFLISIISLVSLSSSNKLLFYSTNHNESVLMLVSFIYSLSFILLGIILYKKDLLKHQYLSCIDILTQTQNRLSYKESIEKYVNDFNNKQIPFSILILDVDNFKSINDDFGHSMGDKVLADLAFLIQNNIRNSDSLFRVGGEEFAILFPNAKLKDSIEIAEKLRVLLEKNLKSICGRTITISIGISEIKTGDDENDLFRRVDDLLYKSKQNGKNRITSDLV